MMHFLDYQKLTDARFQRERLAFINRHFRRADAFVTGMIFGVAWTVIVFSVCVLLIRSH